MYITTILYRCKGNKAVSFRNLEDKGRLQDHLLRVGLAVRESSFFQSGGSNEAAHANSLPLRSSGDFLLFLFGVVRGYPLSDDSRQFTSTE
jgi:hypothetical protein